MAGRFNPPDFDSFNFGTSSLAGEIRPCPTAAEAIRQCSDAYNRGRLIPTLKGIFHRLMALKR